MRFMIIVKSTPEFEAETQPAPDEALFAAMAAYHEELAQRRRAARCLGPATQPQGLAHPLRRRAAAASIDGPFAESQGTDRRLHADLGTLARRGAGMDAALSQPGGRRAGRRDRGAPAVRARGLRGPAHRSSAFATFHLLEPDRPDHPIEAPPCSARSSSTCPSATCSARKAFFKALGLSFNPQFTNEQGACLVIAENIYAMLLVEPFFQGFTKLPIADARKSTEVLICLVVRQPRRGRRAGRQGGGSRWHHAQRAAGPRLHVPARLCRPGRPPVGGITGCDGERRAGADVADALGRPPGHRRRLAHRVGTHRRRGRAHGARRRRGRGAGAGRAGLGAGALASRRACPTTPAPG